MRDDETMKSELKASLQRGRDDLRWKLSGLGERQVRLPRTPTGFTLLGVLKHMNQMEIVYFGHTFGRAWPHSEEVVTDADIELDPQADWCASEAETLASLLDLSGRVERFADETIDALKLDSPGRVPHWPAGADETTLGHIMVHVLVDLTRHLGQADIVREGIDGAAGESAAALNLPRDFDQDAYLERLRGIADRF